MVTGVGEAAGGPVRRLSMRTRLALRAGSLARSLSRLTGRGSGGMIGGQVALSLDPGVLASLARGRRNVIISGTNGKSTTTRMVREALTTLSLGAEGEGVASNINGDNMPPGILTALMSAPRARLSALEVDEMHVPVVARDVDPAGFVLLNLSRDQLDRVGEIGKVEGRLREAVNAHPGAVVVANCDDPLIASAAWDSPHVVWVAAGSGWGDDSVGFPRGGRVVRREGEWQVVPLEGEELGDLTSRPQPDWWLEDVVCEASGARAVLHRRDGWSHPLELRLPGRANLGNAAQAVALAVSLGADPVAAVEAVGRIEEVAGRYARHEIDGRAVRLMLAKNPAGWQEAMSMIDTSAGQVVIGVNGQVADGQDLSWLWDVDFSVLASVPDLEVWACGERGADLAVRLEYAGVRCHLVGSPSQAVMGCRPGRVELLLNYTAMRDFKRVVERGAEAVRAAAREGGRDGE